MAAGRAKDWKMQASTRFCAAIPAGFNRVHMQNVSPGFAVKFVLRMKTIAEWNWSCLWESVTDKAGNTKCNCPRGSLLFCSEGEKKEKEEFLFLFIFFKRAKIQSVRKTHWDHPDLRGKGWWGGGELKSPVLAGWEIYSHPTPACLLFNVSPSNLGISNCCCLVSSVPIWGELFYRLTFSRWQCRAPLRLLPAEMKIIYVSN